METVQQETQVVTLLLQELVSQHSHPREVEVEEDTLVEQLLRVLVVLEEELKVLVLLLEALEVLVTPLPQIRHKEIMVVMVLVVWEEMTETAEEAVEPDPQVVMVLLVIQVQEVVDQQIQ